MNAVSKIHEFLRFGSVLGLERMNALLEKLGNPQDDLKVIHVAGTN
jgi:dihydrofolate synthase/folylpolyglutamate synthase